MGTIQSRVAQTLHANASFLGEGLVQGTLYDLGHYPGLIIEEVDSWVKGHVFFMPDPQQLIPFLDYYEDLNLEQPELSEYRREVISVQLAGKTLDCWAYVYNLPPHKLKTIPDGDYLTYLSNNTSHRDFLNSMRAN